MGGECLRPRPALASRVWWGYPAATPGAVAGVTAPPTAADGQSSALAARASAAPGLGAQQGYPVPRAGAGGLADGRGAVKFAFVTQSLIEPWAARIAAKLAAAS